MKAEVTAPRGTTDILPDEVYKWQYLEQTIKEQAKYYGFIEVRTPVFEHTELFSRGVGEVSDVVQKEMYTFEDKGGRSITLRPEGTAGVVRAMLEHALYNQGLPIKLYYFGSYYRYEKPQAGRLREFNQFGLEYFGTALPESDAELICMAGSIFKKLGIKEISLQINSIGCSSCRQEYYKALAKYLESKPLCKTCQGRLLTNPMRVLDCKNKGCQDATYQAPKILDFICNPCKEHFSGVCSSLRAMGQAYIINHKIVRGLDYYTRTVFEYICEGIGAQSTICGGGRYDYLVEQLGGPSMPALGFGLGLERLLLVMQNQGINPPPEKGCELYIVSIGEKAREKALTLAKTARDSGIITQCDLMQRSIKAQIKYAAKAGALFALVIGQKEVDLNTASLKHMQSGTEIKCEIGSKFLNELTAALKNVN